MVAIEALPSKQGVSIASANHIKRDIRDKPGTARNRYSICPLFLVRRQRRDMLPTNPKKTGTVFFRLMPNRAITGAALASGILEIGVIFCQATGKLDEIEKLKTMRWFLDEGGQCNQL